LSYNIGTIYSIKINSGEELIARVADESETTLTITNPVSVAPGPQGLGLIPTFFTSEAKSVTLYKTSIALVAESEDSVQAKYIEATGGIIVPSKKLILG